MLIFVYLLQIRIFMRVWIRIRRVMKKGLDLNLRYLLFVLYGDVNLQRYFADCCAEIYSQCVCTVESPVGG